MFPVVFFRVFPAHDFSPQETLVVPPVPPPRVVPQEGTQQRSEEPGQRHCCGGLEDLRGDDAQRVEHAEGGLGWEGFKERWGVIKKEFWDEQ